MVGSRLVLLASLALLVGAGACASSGDGVAEEADALKSGRTRDFVAYPAIVEIKGADHVYALSDAHGSYMPLVELLAGNGLIARPTSDPSKAKWSGGTATLILAGDIIDKGGRSLDTIDLLRSLQDQAPRDGGRVIVTMGNHEAEFLADPDNKKAMSTGQDAEGIDPELAARGIDPRRMAAGQDAEGRGRWLAQLPLGVRVKKWFFAHGGNTGELSIEDLGKKLERSIAQNGWGDKDITGAGSILEAQNWYGDYTDKNAGEKEAKALGVEHIVFGHDPGAFKDRGRVRESPNGILVKLDTAMGLHEASGINEAFLLHITTVGPDAVEILDARGKRTKLE